MDIENLRVCDMLRLSEDDEIIKDLYEFKNIRDKKISSIRNFYSSEIESYYKFVLSVAEYLYNVVIPDHDILTYIGAITDLIYTGKLSYNHKYVYNADFDYDDELFGFCGSNIICGYGCCRNLSYFYRDVLRACKFDVQYVTCEPIRGSYLDSELHTRYYNDVYGFDYIEPNNTGIVDPIHAVISFKYDNSRLTFDPVNLALGVVSSTNSHLILSDAVYKLYPPSLVINNDYKWEDVVKYFNALRGRRILNDKVSYYLKIEYGMELVKYINNKYFCEGVDENISEYMELKNQRLDGTVKRLYEKELKVKMFD